MEEIKSLKSNQLKKLPNLVKQLNLFLDDENILRCRKRLEYSDLPYEVKFPILLPNKNHYTRLLIKKCHEDNLHPGTNQMITILRQSYWFPKMRQTVKSSLHPCILCKKILGNHYKMPPVPPLPKDRLLIDRPFTSTGLDYTGALLVKEARNLKKVYVLLFTCATTRAVHLELVDNMTCEAFLRAFRRFINRRSVPSVIYSDNAPTFVKANHYLKKVMNEHLTKNFFLQQKIRWKFIPSRAPWYGGFWERLVGITKTTLKKTIGNSLISRDELHTVLTEVERIVNNRPLTYVSDDLDDFRPLTPSDLIYGYQLGQNTKAPELHENINRVSLTKRQKYCNQLVEHYWERWMKEYTTSLRDFHYNSKGIKPNIGDIVQIKEEIPRHRWKLGRIIKLINGKDGHVRSAEVKTNTGAYIRPIVKLYPLEVGKETETECNEPIRPTREAAIIAKKKIALQLH